MDLSHVFLSGLHCKHDARLSAGGAWCKECRLRASDVDLYFRTWEQKDAVIFYTQKKTPIASHVRYIAFMCKDKVAEACLSAQEAPYVIPIRTGSKLRELRKKRKRRNVWSQIGAEILEMRLDGRQMWGKICTFAFKDLCVLNWMLHNGCRKSTLCKMKHLNC